MPRSAAARVLALILALLVWRTGDGASRWQGSPGQQKPQAAPAAESPDERLLRQVREHIEAERQLLLEYGYRERRRPVRVGKLGKVSIGEEQVFEMRPSGDPDRPRRILLEAGGRPATASEKAEYAGRYEPRPAGPDADADRARRRARAEARVDDAFHVFRFEIDGTEVSEGRLTRVVKVIPRPGAPTKSDLGDWMKKFRGRAWVSEADQQLVRIEMVAIDTIYLGWGFVGRIAEGTRVTYTRKPVADGLWFPASARFELQGRTLMFRSFDVDTTTEWFDYRRMGRGESAPTGSPPPAAPRRE